MKTTKADDPIMLQAVAIQMAKRAEYHGWNPKATIVYRREAASVLRMLEAAGFRIYLPGEES